MTVPVIGYTTVAEIKREAQMSNHTFATDEVEEKQAEAERIVNFYTGRTVANPWLNTEENYYTVSAITRLIAASFLMGKFADKSVQAKAKYDEAFRTLKTLSNSGPDVGDSPAAITIVAGSFEADDFERMTEKGTWFPTDFDSDLRS